MKRAALPGRHAPLKRGPSKLARTHIRRVGKRGLEIRRELDAVRSIVLARDHYLCQRCRDRACTPLEIHHRRARSQGGEHTLDNLVALGSRCHEAVTLRLAADWREWIETRKAVAT